MLTDVYELGVSEFTTWPWTFEEDLARYKSHGIDAIEITEAKLDRARLAEQLALVAAASLKVASVQATVHAIFSTRLQPEPREPADRVRHIRRSIETIAPHVPPGTPFVVITGSPPHGDVEGTLRTARRELEELARCADAHGVRIALEPLNPTLMNVDSAVWALGDALQIVEAVGHRALGLCVDSWNIWQSPDVEATIRRAGDRVFLVQVSDWRPPRGYYDRLVPGEGSLPLASIVGAARGAGYDRPYVVEIFSSESLAGSLWRTDLDAIIDRSIVGFEYVWDAVLAQRPHLQPERC